MADRRTKIVSLALSLAIRDGMASRRVKSYKRRQLHRLFYPAERGEAMQPSSNQPTNRLDSSSAVISRPRSRFRRRRRRRRPFPRNEVAGVM